MHILILGSGGREHAFAWKLKQSSHCENLFVAPGNAGTSQLATNIALSINDFEAIGIFCIENNISLLLVGPEEPLVNGIWDYFSSNEKLKSILLIAPSANAANLEGSKSFAKDFMQRHHIPTASYKEFSLENYDEGVTYLKNHALPIVLKADGLAAGKGVLICENHEEALKGFEQMIQDNKFGDAGKKVVVEQFLKGIECSCFALTDGKNYVLLPSAKDYKRIGEGDTGLNTGGMGAISPVPFLDEQLEQKITSKIIEPTIEGLAKEKFDYVGFVFFGLIIVENEPFVIEYNCRMGDPETEVVMPRLKNDFLELLVAAANGTLNTKTCEIIEEHCSTVMLVSKGYPEDYEKGKGMTGFENCHNALLFHAGTTINNNNEIVSNGGRVLAVSATGTNLKAALKTSYENVAQIHFEGKTFRKDIGWEF